MRSALLFEFFKISLKKNFLSIFFKFSFHNNKKKIINILRFQIWKSGIEFYYFTIVYKVFKLHKRAFIY